MKSKRTGYRRTRRTALAAFGVLTVTFFATSASGAAPGQAAFPPGQGAAFADTMKADPRAGNLSIGIDFGKAAADHQNSAAQAISQAMDLGTIGTSLAAYGCDGSAPAIPQNQQPQPLIADTRTPAQPQQAEQDESFAPGFHKSVAVGPEPSAKAVTTTAPYGVQGVVAVGGGIATATSGAVNGVRKATATTDLSGITFPGGIEFKDLHWGAEYGSDGQPVGTFTIGSASIAGAPIPTNNPSDTINQANQVLALMGLQLTAPTTKVDTVNNTVFVGSMTLSVVPNATRDSISGAAIKGVQPLRESLFDALLKAKCSLSTEITIFDIALGSVTGAGSFNMLFGGVQAGSGVIAANPFNLGFVGDGTPGGTIAGSPGSVGVPGTNGIAGSGPSAGGSGGTTPASGGSRSVSPVSAIVPKGSRGGALAGVGLAGLGMLAAMAEGDRRKMRRAQREIPFTD